MKNNLNDTETAVAQSLRSAVQGGLPVSFSSKYDLNHANPRLNNNSKGPQAWCAGYSDDNQWIQACRMKDCKWICVEIQGRGDYDQWVKSFSIKFTSNGTDWVDFENGKVFEGNSDRNTVMRLNFREPFIATTLRIIPVSWNGHISLRFEAYFQDL